MKTTVELEDALYRTARKRAVDEDRPFRAVLNEALRAYLGVAGTPAPTAPRRKRRRAAVKPPGPHAGAIGSTAEFWAIVNDRSRWDELFDDRTRQIEGQIADATARWNRRARR